MGNKRMKRESTDPASFTKRRCSRSESRSEVVCLVFGRRNPLANSSDLHIARVWIHTIARPE